MKLPTPVLGILQALTNPKKYLLEQFFFRRRTCDEDA